MPTIGAVGESFEMPELSLDYVEVTVKYRRRR